MANVVKVIEVMAESAKSWEDAVQNPVARACETVHGIKSVYADNFSAKVENDRIVEYRVDAKISFVLEPAKSNGKSAKSTAHADALSPRAIGVNRSPIWVGHIHRFMGVAGIDAHLAFVRSSA
jgi:dodecin